MGASLAANERTTIRQSRDNTTGSSSSCDIELIEFILDSFICLFPAEQQAPCSSCHARYRQKQQQEEEYGIPEGEVEPFYDYRGKTSRVYQCEKVQRYHTYRR